MLYNNTQVLDHVIQSKEFEFSQLQQLSEYKVQVVKQNAEIENLKKEIENLKKENERHANDLMIKNEKMETDRLRFRQLRVTITSKTVIVITYFFYNVV